MCSSLKTYIDWELSRHPDKLPRIGLELLDAALMGLPNVYRIAPQIFDDLEVMAEHIGVLVILG